MAGPLLKPQLALQPGLVVPDGHLTVYVDHRYDHLTLRLGGHFLAGGFVFGYIQILEWDFVAGQEPLDFMAPGSGRGRVNRYAFRAHVCLLRLLRRLRLGRRPRKVDARAGIML